MTASPRGADYIVGELGMPDAFGPFSDGCEQVGDVVEAALGQHPDAVLDSGYGWGISHAIWLHRWPEAHVFCVGPDFPGDYAEHSDATAKQPHCLDRVDGEVKRRFRFKFGRLEFARHLVERCFPFIFVDTEHEYPAQVYQVAAAWTVLEPGGVLAGHDYDQLHVRVGTDEVLTRAGVQAVEIVAGDGHNFWHARKPPREEEGDV